MPSIAGLIKTDPLISNQFSLEIDGDVVAYLSSVSGMEMDVDVQEIKQVGKGGQMQHIKTLGAQSKAGEMTITRMAPLDSTGDPLWKWFNDIRQKGLSAADRSSNRKNGSIVLYDTTNKEVSRWNFEQAWPSKISQGELGADSGDAVKETITMQYELLERKK